MSDTTWELLLPAEIDPAGPERVSEFTATTSIDEYEDRDALLEDVDRFDAIITRTERIDRELIERASSLEIVSKHGVGVDNIDVEAATERGVIVSNTPGVNSRAVAEHAITLLLAVRRRLREADAAVRGGGWDDHDVATDQLLGDVLGLFGCGDIGLEVADLATGLGMDPLTYDPYVDEGTLPAGVSTVQDPGELFERADAVSVHTPLTPETRGAVGENELAALGPDGLLINTARAEIVDRDALGAALEDGTLAGAGLDVFSPEPPGRDHPLLPFDNVVATPHVGAQTTEALRDASLEAAANVRTVYEGGVPESAINGDAF
ncbi:hydroxyacid dehydrogenase [Halobiforma lacisalsi AJ5]|uniref:D-3-phosphoglycerate dehydrogenase n=1 Tax=Natronobacterium lacisalsi AJ5 TaxID=358396 RepID=M0LV60_NATLA|nr:hydroxyacid dehydrogenase [Halobiforma lacisalsi]APW97791.1 hydroxyacid dehydrogenase [Halobiforma lacisalsi AJ5]EMA37462.1 D-3-phosphoglycerate dehydrogenase [Halobiforma lacisalsi AJ5]